MTAYHDATLKKAGKRSGKGLVRVGRYKCPRCRQLRGSMCGFDKKHKRFHMMNRFCGTLEALKDAFKDVGRSILENDRSGYFAFYQAEVDGIVAVGYWKYMFDKFLCAVEVEDGKLVPMRLSTAEAVISAANRHYSEKYEDGGL